MRLREIVARNLRRLRHAKGMSQEELADRADINRNYVGMLEREQHAATIDMLEKLADVLEVDPIAFFEKPDKSRLNIEFLHSLTLLLLKIIKDFNDIGAKFPCYAIFFYISRMRDSIVFVNEFLVGVAYLGTNNGVGHNEGFRLIVLIIFLQRYIPATQPVVVTAVKSCLVL